MACVKKRGQPPVLPEPVVAFGQQQATADDRLQQPSCKYIGLVAMNVRIEDVIYVVGVIQTDKPVSELAK